MVSLHCAALLRRLLALLALMLALVTPATAGVLRIERALGAESDASRFPENVPQRTVSLPDDWNASRPGHAGPVWYRVRFDAPLPQDSGELLALYVERACSNLEVQLNGQRLHVAGRMREPMTRNCHHAQLVTLPAALLRAEGNLLDIKVAGQPLERVGSRLRAGGLSALELGPHAALAPLQERHYLLNVTLPLVLSGSLLLLGSFMCVLGWLNRRHSHLAYFGMLAVGSALLTARLGWRDLPLTSFETEVVLASLMPVVTLAAVQFLLRRAGQRTPRLGLVLVLQCVLVPASLLLGGSARVHLLSNAWATLLALEVMVALARFLRRAWRRRGQHGWAVAMLIAGTVALVMVQLLALLEPPSSTFLALVHLSLPLTFIGMGLRLVQQHGRALQDAEADRRVLEARIREATEEIERNFAQLTELRIEQVTERERKRIAADLHDDLGAKLLTIVHTSDNERISTLAREALEEMRLSVRGLTGRPVRLIDALGDWRAEAMSRLAQTGIEARWVAPTDDMPQTLSARAYVQTTRILREAVNNIIKHSGATHCTVTCQIEGGDFQLAIQDNGRGIPMELDGRLDRGHGMSSMKHRAKQLQGQCLVESGPGYGTVIRLTLPLERHAVPA